jgi:hypothetical protein
MAKPNPDLMQLDNEATGAPRVAGPRTDTSIDQSLTDDFIDDNFEDFDALDFTADDPDGETDGTPRKAVGTFTDPNTGSVYTLYDDGTRALLSKGTLEADAIATAAKEKLAKELAATTAAAEKKAIGQSAFDLLTSEFGAFGMSGLVAPLRSFIEEGISRDEFVLRLRNTDAYKKRFAANAQRTAKGLRALSEAEYIQNEDSYQDVMRRYGLPESYYTRGDMGRQEGFEKFIAGDVSSVELEDRIQTAQKRVLNANPEVSQALKEFYPGISNGDILAYVLDPTNAIENIKRKVSTAEIGGAAYQSGLKTGVERAEELARYGVTKESAQQGYGTIAGGLQRGSQLASIYGEDPYTQTTAEQEVFNIAGAQEARKQRQKITGLEKAAFGGQSGISSSALTRDRAGTY